MSELLARAGEELLETLGATVIVFRVLDGQHLDTVGAVGATRPTRPRVPLDEAATARVTAWIDAGAAVHARGPLARDILAGVGELDERAWLLVPLTGGVMIVGSEANIAIDQRELAGIAGTVSAAISRVQLRDISASVVGADAGLRDVMRQVEQVSPTAAPVLILGETGSGKEVVARAIHERSPRARGPVLRVNCGAIPPELVDSELFGHERGSFTGAATQRRGWFERAHGGTLFLDEVAELPLAAQVRLLRVLQDGVFERVGGSRPLKVDVRVVAATHRDLAAMARAGTFREDLWYRIHVFVIRLPPLRERHGDIRALAEHFAERAGKRFGAGALHVSDRDVTLLQRYDWPGNVRELSAVIERAAILGEGKGLDVERALGVRAAGDRAFVAGDRFPTLDEAMRDHIERALVRCHGRVEGPRGAAKLLGINANTLRSRMTKLAVRRPVLTVAGEASRGSGPSR